MNDKIPSKAAEPSLPSVSTAISGKYLLDSLLEHVNKDTSAALERLLPKAPTGFMRSISSVTSNATSGSLDIDARTFRALSVPLWEMLGRTRKGWRSYVLRVSCEAVGGQFSNFLDWLALPEILHVGSLIIDDIQDSSEIRRGGKACHLLYGIGPAINVGTFAYFVGRTLIEKSSLNDAKKLALYQEYVSLLREAHIGQGLDIEGLDLTRIGCDANADCIVDAIMDIHRRKSGVVFGSFARMGAILGDGSASQTRALGDYFEDIGTLFQVRDDIMNITGSHGNLPRHCEDLRRGKVTIPVAVALKNLPGQARRVLVRQLLSSSLSPESLVRYLLEAISTTNSIHLCETLIEEGYKSAWGTLQNDECKLSNMENIMLFSRRIVGPRY